MTPIEQRPVTYRVTFDRIGSKHNVQPQVFEARDADDLAQQIHRYARRHLGSREVEVVADLLERRGSIFVGGFRSGGRFTIELTDDPADHVA